MNRRRKFLLTIGAVSLLYANRGGALDAEKRPHIGYIGRSPIKNRSGLFRKFRDELQRLGYIEGKTVVIDYRAHEGQLDRIAGLVQDLVRSKVDVLVAQNTVAIQAAQRATKSIPIVMATPVDPIAAGFAKSLRQPGGNITGIYTLRAELSAKRVELLTELVPGISRVAILWDADAPGPRLRFQDYLAAANILKLDIQSLEISAPTPDLQSAFQAARAKRSQALIIIGNPLVSSLEEAVAALAAQYGLPSIGESRRFTSAGGLISYGEDLDEQPKVLASIVVRILKGAKPADLPIQQPTMFELAVNLKTAKQIGLTIPPNVLVRATRVIQ